MKKGMFLLSALLLAGSYVNAACTGGDKFCYDDVNASVNGRLFNRNGDGVFNMTKATVATSTPSVLGQHVFCTDCTNLGGGRGIPCYSTTTANAQNAYVAVGSATAVTACQ